MKSLSRSMSSHRRTNMFDLTLFVFYGIIIGLACLLVSFVIVLSASCCRCRRQYRHRSIYFYGISMLMACLSIGTGLTSFLCSWLSTRQTLTDGDMSVAFQQMIHEQNQSLKYIESLGTSFWLACGSASLVLCGLTLSCCLVRTWNISRTNEKQYEIIYMTHY
jgi:H+/Cl- antiporter ClcA